MTQSHNEMIAVIAAHRDGELIQYRAIGYGEWIDRGIDGRFNFKAYEYRIKPSPPKPREFWLNTKSRNALEYDEANGANPDAGWIHVIEVLAAPSV